MATVRVDFTSQLRQEDCLAQIQTCRHMQKSFNQRMKHLLIQSARPIPMSLRWDCTSVQFRAGKLVQFTSQQKHKSETHS